MPGLSDAELTANIAKSTSNDNVVYPHGEGAYSVGTLIWNVTKNVFNNQCGMSPEAMKFLVPLIISINNCYSAKTYPIFRTDPNKAEEEIHDFFKIKKKHNRGAYYSMEGR